MSANIFTLIFVLILFFSTGKFELNNIFFRYLFGFICLMAISVHLLILIKRYTGKPRNIISILTIVMFVSSMQLYKTPFNLKVIMLCLNYLTIAGIIIGYMFFEKIYLKRKYNSFILRTKLWEKTDYFFKWNYLDLHKFAPRSSFIVVLIAVGIVGLNYSEAHVNISEKILFLYVILDILFGVSYLAALDRRNEYLKFIHEGRGIPCILRIVSIQFSWVISRGVVIGVIALAIMDRLMLQLDVNYIYVFLCVAIVAILSLFTMLICNYIYLYVITLQERRNIVH